MASNKMFLATRAMVVLLAITSGQGRVVKRSDDVNVGVLRNMVQQQASTIQQLQAEVRALQALKTEVDVLSSKTSKPVAFTAHFAYDGASHGVSLGANPVLQFDSVTTNIGQGYDNHTGMFTAPCAGTYAFYLTEMAPNEHGSLILSIMRDDDVLMTTWAPGSEDKNDPGSTVLVTTRLDAGQRVWVRHNYGDAVRGGHLTIFTGFLLHAE